MEEAVQGISFLLKTLRSRRGYSQAAVAEALDVPLRTYQSWEKAYTSTAANLFAVARFFGVPADAFFAAAEAAASGRPEAVEFLASPAFAVAAAAARGAGPEEIEASFPGFFAGADRDEAIHAAILDAYFRSPSAADFLDAPRDAGLEEELGRALGLGPGAARVVDTRAYRFPALREISLGRHGADLVLEWSRGSPAFRLGIANGYTLARILDALPRNSAGNLSLFPLNFTQTPADFPISTSSLISAFQYRHEGRCAEYRPLGEVEVYGAALLADAAILGIGTLRREGLYSRMISATLGSAYLDRVRAAGAAGDFNYYPLDGRGARLDFPELVGPLGDLDSRALIKAVDLEVLARKADRGCPVAVAAAGAHKAELVRLVVSGGYANRLLVDSSLAEALLSGRAAAAGR